MNKFVLILGGGAAVVIAVGYYFYNQSLLSGYKAEERANWEKRDAEVERLKAKRSRNMKDIQRFGGDGSCKEHSDCKAIGLGTKTCGGYRTFFHYSVSALGDEVEFFAAVRHHNIADERINKLLYKVPDCGVKELESLCINGKCGPRP